MAAATDDSNKTPVEIDDRSTGITGIKRTVYGYLATIDGDDASDARILVSAAYFRHEESRKIANRIHRRLTPPPKTIR